MARQALAQAAQALHAAPQVEWPDAALGRAAAFVITASENLSNCDAFRFPLPDQGEG